MVEEAQRHRTSYLSRDMQRALMALSSSLNLIIVKAGKQFSGYVSNFTQSKKYKTKLKLLCFQSQGV